MQRSSSFCQLRSKEILSHFKAKGLYNAKVLFRYAEIILKPFIKEAKLNELKERGLTVETGLQISYASASDSAALAVIQEKTDVAIMSWPNYTKLNDEIKKQVEINNLRRRLEELTSSK